MIKNYIALDLETTGLHPSEDRILEIGAVKVVNGEITDRYETLVNPGMAISPRIQELTGINDAMAATGKGHEDRGDRADGVLRRPAASGPQYPLRLQLCEEKRGQFRA